MQITDLFERDIHRSINGVIKADQSDDANVWQELEEYVITHELGGHLRKFFDTYVAAQDNPAAASGNIGVWVSGFFGSGKSHFIKILSYLLANREVTQAGKTRTALEFFEEKITDPMLAGDIERAVKGETDVLLFNIDSKADSGDSRDAILRVFLKVFNEMCGFTPDHPHIAQLERELADKGALDTFKARFEQDAGSSWEAERDGYAFYTEAVAVAYGAAMGQEVADADAWLDRLERDFRNWLTPENFCRMVREYLDQRGKQHRIVFLADEIGQFIGSNTQLMLNLQTITEDLGTICDGRAWLVVTSQEDVDAVIGQLRSNDANDFSKIQGRFRTRLSLSSANVDEVIQKRLLQKTDAAVDVLQGLYGDQADILKNQLSFSYTGRTMKAFGDGDEFAAVYPFVPYQFSLVQSIFESVRKAGATGLHLARGERSLLDAFQSATKAVGEDAPGALVPLYRFYPSIESFLEGVVKSTIDNAAGNPSLEDFDVLVLKTLFLIRYVDEMPGNIDNLITLFIDEIDADRGRLREQLEASLQRLEGQTLVSRNGDNFFFLTNEERDISREIKAVELTGAEEAKKLGQILFDSVLRGQRKFRFSDNGNDFGLNLSCDMQPYGNRSDGGLNLLIITPLMDDRAQWTDSKCLLQSGEQGGQVILRLPDEHQLATELRQYLQTDKYLLRHNDASLSDSAKRIVRDRADENRQRDDRLRRTLERLLSQAMAFVSGHQPQLQANSAQTLVDAALHDLVRNTFSKLGYIEYPTPEPQSAIRALLDDPSNLSLDLGSKDTFNARALKEVQQYVELARSQHRQVILHDVAAVHFARRPYGWPEWETVHLVVRLVKAGGLSLHANNTPLAINQIWGNLNPPSRWRSVEIQRRQAVGSAELKQARDLARNVFGTLPPDDEDRLHEALRQQLTTWQGQFGQWRSLAESAGYPGKNLAQEGKALCDKLLAAPDSYTAIDLFRQHKDELHDAAEDYQDLKHFFDNQKPVWDKLVDGLRRFQSNRPALEKDNNAQQALQRLEQIRQQPAPFGALQEVEGLTATVDKVNTAAIDKVRTHTLDFIDKQLQRVTNDLDKVDADADTRNSSLLELQRIRQATEKESSIAHLYQLSSRATEAADEALDALAKKTSEPAAGATGIAEEHGSGKIKPIQRIFANSLCDGYIEDEAEADQYIEQLRKEIKSALAAGKRVDIR